MEKTSTLVNNIYSNAKEYISLKTRSVKLDVYDKAAGAAAGAVNGVIMAVLGLCAFIFLNVGLAYWLSEVFESTKLGFLTLGGIYVVLIGIYFALKTKISTSIKNSVVHSMSKESITDYEVMMKEKHQVEAQLERAETVVKGNIEELKDNVDTLVEDFKRLKEDVQRFKHLFGAHDHHDHDEKMKHSNGSHHQNGAGHGNSVFPKIAMSTVLELLINKFVLKDVISLKKTILPIIAKAFITTKMGQNGGGNSKPNGLIEVLKSKLSKFL